MKVCVNYDGKYQLANESDLLEMWYKTKNPYFKDTIISYYKDNKLKRQINDWVQKYRPIDPIYPYLSNETTDPYRTMLFELGIKCMEMFFDDIEKVRAMTNQIRKIRTYDAYRHKVLGTIKLASLPIISMDSSSTIINSAALAKEILSRLKIIAYTDPDFIYPLVVKDALGLTSYGKLIDPIPYESLNMKELEEEINTKYHSILSIIRINIDTEEVIKILHGYQYQY